MACKQVISPRSGFQAVMFEDWPLVIGGMEGFNNYASDVWYRGMPSLHFTVYRLGMFQSLVIQTVTNLQVIDVILFVVGVE